MSSVFKRSGSWYLRYKTAAGTWAQEVSAARNREEAKHLAAELELKHERIRRGTDVEPGDPTLTFGKLFEWWWESHGCRLSSTTVAAKGPSFRKHVLPSLEALVLRQVTAARLEQLFDELETTLAGATVNMHRSMLRAIFARAAKRGLWIGANPAAATEKRKELRRDFDSLAVDEVPTLLASLDERWRPLFATAVFTGMRKGELAGLRRADVDLVAGTIRVRRSWGADRTKGGSEVTLPIASPLRPYLEASLRAHRSEFVFPGADGKMMPADTKLQHVLRRALSRAGLAQAWEHVCRRTTPKRCGFSERRDNDVSQPCPQCGFRLWPKAVHREIRFHDLRATTATLLARSGAGLAVAQRVLRHADPSLTSNVYTRVSLEQMREALDGIVPAMVPMPSAAPAEPVAAAVNAEPLAAPVLQASEAATRVESGAVQPVALAGESKWVQEVSNLRPLPCQGGETDRNATAPRALALNGPPSQVVASRLGSFSASGATPFTSRVAAPVLHDAGTKGPRRASVDASMTQGRPLLGVVAALLTVRQVAAQLAVSTATVYALVERGELEHVRVSNAIRISPAALERYLAKGRR